MSHDITQTDGMVLVGKAAWHGLGRVVEEAPTPAEALQLAKLDWMVEQWPLSSTNGEGLRLAVDTHVLNVRSDTHEPLGVVGEGYRPVQNRELAEFASALAQDTDTVRVESAASIQGGKRVWFLLRGQSFAVKQWDDTVVPYLLLAMGHDGSLAVHMKPTSIRVVCRNTLNMSLGEKSEFSVRFKHEGDIQSKLAEAKRALGLYQKTAEAFEEKVNVLAARTMSRDEIQRFFLDVYAQAFEPIPTAPTTEAGKKAAYEAKKTLNAWCAEMDIETRRVGATAWGALNAVTGWMQNKDQVRGRDQRARNENRLRSKLFGTIEDRTDTAARMALALA